MSVHRLFDWMRFHCGDLVCDLGDERHIGCIDAILSSGLIKVRWQETGWISYVPYEKLRLVQHGNVRYLKP